MASESSSERTVSITLPSELDDWLDEQAARVDLDRDQLLTQLVASYRTTMKVDREGNPGPLVEDADIVESIDERVTEQLSTQVDDRIEDLLQERLESEVESAVDSALKGQVTEATNSIQRQLGNRIDAVESEFDGKIQDVRERVIQIKKETDRKAAADHHHEAFDQVEELNRQVKTLETDLSRLRREFDELVPDHDESIDGMGDQLESVQERLQTVAWVVSDLREAHEKSGGLRAVERIKRAAAKADIERANCENCGQSVAISLLTDPECPHCNATVSNVEPSGGWFGKPKLLAASQLESGDE